MQYIKIHDLLFSADRIDYIGIDKQGVLVIVMGMRQLSFTLKPESIDSVMVRITRFLVDKATLLLHLTDDVAGD